MIFVLSVLASGLFGASFGAFVSWFCEAKIDTDFTLLMAVISVGCYVIPVSGWMLTFNF